MQEEYLVRAPIYSFVYWILTIAEEQTDACIPTPGKGDPDKVALFLDGYDIGDPLRLAVLECDKREDAGVGDIEPGQHLEYPCSPSLSSSELHSPFSSPITPLASSPHALPPHSPSSTCAPIFPEVHSDVPAFSLDNEVLAAAPSPMQHTKPKNHKKRGKAAKAAKLRAAARPSTYKIRLSLSNKYKNNNRVDLPEFRMLRLKTIALGSWIARRCSVGRGLKTLEEVLAEGLRLVRWDGRCVF